MTDSVTVSTENGAAFDTFTVDFGTVHPVTSTFVIDGDRIPERAIAVTKGSGINSTELEKEFSKLATEHQELRRRILRSFLFLPGEVGRQVKLLSEGHFYKADANGNLVDGGSATDIANAQTNAENAEAARIAAEAHAAALSGARFTVSTISLMTGLSDANTGAGDFVFVASNLRGGYFQVLEGTPAANGLTVDNGTIFVSDGGTRTLVRSYTGRPDATWFQTAGDGLVDDRAALAALDGLGQAFHLRSGTYRVSSNLTINSPFTRDPDAKFLIDGGVALTINAGPELNILTQLFAGSGSVVFGDQVPKVVPDWFCETVDGITDNGADIQKCHDACVANRVPFEWVNRYSSQQELFWDVRVPSIARGGAALLGLGTGTAGITLNDTTYLGENRFPYINGFVGHGLKLQGTDLANIHIPVISNCGTAIWLQTVNASYATCVDNNIHVEQIGACETAIKMDADNSDNIMQGNQVFVNFALTTKYGVYWESNGLSSSIDWDSNLFEFLAVDPLTSLTDAVFIYNPNASLSVDKQTYSVKTWIGAFASTAKLIEGRFSNFKAYLSSAQAWEWGQINITGTNNAICLNDVMGAPNTSIACMSTDNSRASFNGGACVYRNKVKLKYTLTADLVHQAVLPIYTYHLLTDGNTNLFSIGPSDEGSSEGITILSVKDNSAVNDNEIILNITNQTGTAVPSGTTFFFTLFVGSIVH